jgi:hypothetical protein
MTISTTWSIAQCNREVSTGKILEVEALCVATDSEEPTIDDGKTQLTGVCSVTVDFLGEVTIAYDDVTQDDVIGWVKSQLGEDSVAGFETAAQELLTSQSRRTSLGLPWVTD